MLQKFMNKNRHNAVFLHFKKVSYCESQQSFMLQKLLDLQSYNFLNASPFKYRPVSWRVPTLICTCRQGLVKWKENNEHLLLDEAIESQAKWVNTLIKTWYLWCVRSLHGVDLTDSKHVMDLFRSHSPMTWTTWLTVCFSAHRPNDFSHRPDDR